MGALSYEPSYSEGEKQNSYSLDALYKEIKLFNEKDNMQFVDELWKMEGSSGGARPKIILKIEEK